MTINAQNEALRVSIEPGSVDAFLMCPPDRYRTSFLFNPWLDYTEEEVDPQRARDQWSALAQIIENGGSAVRLIEPSPDSSSMVFTADCALVYTPGKAVLLRNDGPRSNYEPALVRSWMQAEEFQVESLPSRYRLDGGNILRMSDRSYLVGLKPGSDGVSERYLSRLLKLTTGAQTLPLALIDRRFLHLDMVVGNIGGLGLLVYWEGLHPASRQHLKRWVGDSVPLINVDREDALKFACNTVTTVNATAITGPVSDALASRIEALGVKVERLDLSEYYKAGGGAKCLTLPLTYVQLPSSIRRAEQRADLAES